LKLISTKNTNVTYKSLNPWKLTLKLFDTIEDIKAANLGGGISKYRLLVKSTDFR